MKSCLKEFTKYTALNVIGMLGLSCYILADTFFISRGLGADGLTALNLAIPIYSFIHGCGLMLGIGGATRYSIYHARKDSAHSDAIFTGTLEIAAVLACLFVLTGLFCSRPITALLGADTKVFDMTNTYLKTILLFSPAFIINEVMICFVRNDGNPRLAMTAMLTGSFSNILLDYVFIFPCRMGIFGAVLATGFAPVISMLVLSKHRISRRNGFHLVRVLPRPADIFPTISLGIPSLVTEVSAGLVIIVFNIIILGLSGNIGVAAYGVIANLSLVVTAIFTGIAQGIQPLISDAYGKNEPVRIRRFICFGLVTTLTLSLALYAGTFIFADTITGIFNSENNFRLQEIAVYGLRLYFMAAPFVGFNIVISSCFTSVEKAVPAHLISLLRGFILIIPMTFALSNLAGITGVWMAFPLTEGIVAALILAWLWVYKNCRKFQTS